MKVFFTEMPGGGRLANSCVRENVDQQAEGCILLEGASGVPHGDDVMHVADPQDGGALEDPGVLVEVVADVEGEKDLTTSMATCLSFTKSCIPPGWRRTTNARAIGMVQRFGGKRAVVYAVCELDPSLSLTLITVAEGAVAGVPQLQDPRSLPEFSSCRSFSGATLCF